MASEKGRGDNQHDKNRDDDDMTTITSVLHRSEELMNDDLESSMEIKLNSITSRMKNLVITNRNH